MPMLHSRSRSRSSRSHKSECRWSIQVQPAWSELAAAAAAASAAAASVSGCVAANLANSQMNGRWVSNVSVPSIVRLSSSWSSLPPDREAVDLQTVFVYRSIDRSIQARPTRPTRNQFGLLTLWLQLNFFFLPPPLEQHFSGWSWATLLVKFLIYLSFN